MPEFSYADTFILVDKESTFNVAVASPSKDLGIVGTVSPELTNNIIEVRGIGDREPQSLVPGVFDGTISIDGTLNSGAVLELFWGQAIDTETTGDYKHVFVERGVTDILNYNTSFTLMENLSTTADITFKHAGCVFNSITVNMNVNEIVSFSSEIFSSSVTEGTTAGTQVKTTTTPLSFADVVVKTGTAGSETTVSKVKNASVTMSNGYAPEDVKALGSRFNQNLIPKNLEITGEITLVFNSIDEYTKFKNAVPFGMVIQATNGVTLGSGRIEFYVKMLDVQYETESRTDEVDGIIEETFSYRSTNIDDVYFVDQISSYF